MCNIQMLLTSVCFARQSSAKQDELYNIYLKESGGKYMHVCRRNLNGLLFENV